MILSNGMQHPMIGIRHINPAIKESAFFEMHKQWTDAQNRTAPALVISVTSATRVFRFLCKREIVSS